tara:strand:+ start:32661 stop:33128 length:468 start_codon:yes stop_codon:yes gene_type:complete
MRDHMGEDPAGSTASKDNGPEGRELFGIADLAEEFGITTRTIRFYENKNLIHPARVNGSRVYTRRDRARLALILRAKTIGSSLVQISHFLDLYGEQGEGRAEQMDYVVRETTKAIAELEMKQELIRDTLKELREIRQGCMERLPGYTPADNSHKV